MGQGGPGGPKWVDQVVWYFKIHVCSVSLYIVLDVVFPLGLANEPHLQNLAA